MAPRKRTDTGVRVNFRLNPARPKDRVILEFLRMHAENYDASRIIKQALYEMATGRSWVSAEAADPSAWAEDAEPPRAHSRAQDQRAAEVLDDILAGLGDWEM